MQQVNNLKGVKVMPKNVAVRLGDGTIISLSDLPSTNTTRWVASNKAAVVRVFMAGLIHEKDVIERYGLSAEEFQSWIDRYITAGKNGLKVTTTKEIRELQAGEI